MFSLSNFEHSLNLICGTVSEGFEDSLKQTNFINPALVHSIPHQDSFETNLQSIVLLL